MEEGFAMDASYTGDKICELRKKKNMTQKELAKLLNVTNKAVSKWECGKNFPDLILLQPLAEILGTSVSDLLGLEKNLSDDTIAVISAISQQEKRSIKISLYQFTFFAMLTGILYLIFHFLITGSNISGEDFWYWERIILTFNVVVFMNGALMLEKLHKKFTSPKDFRWPADRDTILFANFKIQIALWKEKLKRL